MLILPARVEKMKHKILKHTLELCSTLVLLLSQSLAIVLPQDELNDLRDQLKNAIDHSNVGASYAHMLNFFFRSFSFSS